MEKENSKNYLEHFKTVLKRQVGFAIFITIVAFFLVSKENFPGWAIGCFCGLMDTILMLQGARKGMEEEPEKSLGIMHITMLKRMGFLGLIVIVMLRMGLNVFGVFICSLLLHIASLINFLIIALKDKKSQP